MAEDARAVFAEVKKQKKIGSFVIDAFRSETHRQSNTVTRFPVEDGSDINDHVISNPDVLEIQGIVGAVILSDIDTGTNRTLDAFNELTRLKVERNLISIVTGLKVYDNMIIESFNVPRNSTNGGSLSFSMTLKNINIVESQSTVIPKTILTGDEETKQQAQSEADIGKSSSGQTQQDENDDFMAQIEADVDEILAAFD